jgi:L-lysine 2,3-aminomutase
LAETIQRLFFSTSNAKIEVARKCRKRRISPVPLTDGQLTEKPKPSRWTTEMGQSFRHLSDLLAFLELDPQGAPFPLEKHPDFPFLVTRAFANRMAKGNWKDPLLAQILPLEKEKWPVDGFVVDAVGDGHAQCAPGLLHKYANRVLLMPTAACAIHCRYCFRRHFGYADLPKAQDSWQQAWDYLVSPAGKVIEEVVLSGGDPLSLDNKRLEFFVAKVLSFENIKTLRLHTRLPIVLPSRVDDGFLQLMGKAVTHRTVVLVVHSNHANEWDREVTTAVRKLQSLGVMVLNQSVLLRGVNDSAEDLIHLSQTLIHAGVLPYYLHLLDRVQGTSHFEVDETKAMELVTEMRARLQGYAVPKLVREIPGEPFKSQVPYDYAKLDRSGD